MEPNSLGKGQFIILISVNMQIIRMQSVIGLQRKNNHKRTL